MNRGLQALARATSTREATARTPLTIPRVVRSERLYFQHPTLQALLPLERPNGLAARSLTGTDGLLWRGCLPEKERPRTTHLEPASPEPAPPPGDASQRRETVGIRLLVNDNVVRQRVALLGGFSRRSRGLAKHPRGPLPHRRRPFRGARRWGTGAATPTGKTPRPTSAPEEPHPPAQGDGAPSAAVGALPTAPSRCRS